MTQINKEQGFNIAKIGVVVAAIALGYNMYVQLSNKMDKLVTLEEKVGNHIENDKDLHAQQHADYMDLTSRMEEHLREYRK